MGVGGQDMVAAQPRRRVVGRRARRARAWWVGSLLGTAALLTGGAGVTAWVMWHSARAQADRALAAESAYTDSERQLAELQTAREGLARRVQALEEAQAQAAPNPQGRRSQREALDALERRLSAALRPELRRKDAWLTRSGAGLQLALGDRLLFSPGASALTPEGQALLARAAGALGAPDAWRLYVTAHTDNAPGGEGMAPPAESWALTSARAVAVVQLLSAGAHLPHEALLATGAGAFHPAASNDTPQGRARNRRVELLLVPAPAPAPAPVAKVASAAARVSAKAVPTVAKASEAKPGTATTDRRSALAASKKKAAGVRRPRAHRDRAAAR